MVDPTATHRCAADDCDEQISHDHLMCRIHWYRVPQDIRNEVWRTFRRIHRDQASYIEARNEAIASLRPDAAPAAPSSQGDLF